MLLGLTLDRPGFSESGKAGGGFRRQEQKWSNGALPGAGLLWAVKSFRDTYYNDLSLGLFDVRCSLSVIFNVFYKRANIFEIQGSTNTGEQPSQ